MSKLRHGVTQLHSIDAEYHVGDWNLPACTGGVGPQACSLYVALQGQSLLREVSLALCEKRKLLDACPETLGWMYKRE